MTQSAFQPEPLPRRPRLIEGEKLRGADKIRRIPVKVLSTPAPVPSSPSPLLPKPDWLRVRLPASPRVAQIKRKLRAHNLASVCEEASCPNLGECFGNGTATFMIMGDICTRRCPFCDVAHGKPRPLDPDEPQQLAAAIRDLGLRYVVITSVDRDDLADSGAAHFAACIRQTRRLNPAIEIEVLVPDFRGRAEKALATLAAEPPDVFNHNLETVPRLYRQARPGADYRYSLDLLAAYKARQPAVPTKSGLMLGLGEDDAEIKAVLQDLRASKVDMLTLGQYLQPSRAHLPVQRFVHPDTFAALKTYAESLGFTHVASGPLVRSSYHADRQARGETVGETVGEAVA